MLYFVFSSVVMYEYFNTFIFNTKADSLTMSKQCLFNIKSTSKFNVIFEVFIRLLKKDEILMKLQTAQYIAQIQPKM